MSSTDRRNRRIHCCAVMLRPPILSVLVLLYAGATRASADSDLRVIPQQVVLEGKTARQQLAVTFSQPDGTLRDVTASCRYVVEAESIAEVTSAGIVFPRADGSAVLRTTFENQTTEVEVRVARAGWIRAQVFERILPLFSRRPAATWVLATAISAARGAFASVCAGKIPSLIICPSPMTCRAGESAGSLPERSLVVEKPTAVIAHEGGLRFRRDSIEAKTLLAWIAAGADDDRAGLPRVKALRSLPRRTDSWLRAPSRPATRRHRRLRRRHDPRRHAPGRL